MKKLLTENNVFIFAILIIASGIFIDLVTFQLHYFQEMLRKYESCLNQSRKVREQSIKTHKAFNEKIILLLDVEEQRCKKNSRNIKY